MKGVACFLGVLTLAGGCVLEDVAVPPDLDGGVEAGVCVVCPFDKPICNDETEQCVACTADDVGYCTQQGLLCDSESFACVDCLSHADCTAIDAAKCDSEMKECIPCDSHEQCNDVEGLPGENNACNADGICVQCTPETEPASCGGKSCDPATGTCTDKDVGSLDICEACVADSECGLDGEPSDEFRCVPMLYKGRPFPDERTGFCLKVFSIGGCEQPYAIPISGRASLSGESVTTYCGIRESLATCPAVHALDRNLTCPGGSDDACPEGGLCRDVGGLATRCTYPCDASQQCLPSGGDPNNPNPGSECVSGGSGLYCGG